MHSDKIGTIFGCALAICLCRVASAIDRYVPSQYGTIQSAISASSSGDRVLVSPGIYREYINFNGRNITVKATGGAAVTTIDASGTGRRVVQFTSGETNAAVLDGFTLRGGNPTTGTLVGHGGGILCCYSSSPTILNCVVRDNTAALGGGMYNCSTTCPRLGNTKFCNNLCTDCYGWDIAQCTTDLGGNIVCAACDCNPGDIVEFRVSDGGNGHFYQACLQNGQLSWWNADSYARAVGGRLAVIDSQAIQQFVRPLIRPYSNAYWIGLRQDSNPTEPLGNWRWLNGFALSFANWATSQPDNSKGAEDFCAIGLDGSWADWRDIGDNFPGRMAIRGYVVEWFADCNGDGFVDYGQIRRGELVDADGDNVPDCCEIPGPCAGVIRVPAQFPSIQAAVDAAVTGDRIEVSEGTYSGSLNLRGKAITIKATGSRANTILDGTGLAGPVVRATSGETSATLLQGFTIRNGTAGSLVNGQRVGGGMLVQNASPTIRDCAFVSNSAEAGGGLAAINSQSLIDGCIFSTNTASTGGGMWFDGGRPTVSGCVVTGNSASGHGGGLYATPMPGQLPNAVLSGNTLCSNTSADAGRENLWALFDDGGNAICDCFGDVDGNGISDPADISLALLFFGSATDLEFIQPDQDMNGTVDTGDVSVLLLNFGPCE